MVQWMFVSMRLLELHLARPCDDPAPSSPPMYTVYTSLIDIYIHSTRHSEPSITLPVPLIQLVCIWPPLHPETLVCASFGHLSWLKSYTSRSQIWVIWVIYICTQWTDCCLFTAQCLYKYMVCLSPRWATPLSISLLTLGPDTMATSTHSSTTLSMTTTDNWISHIM